MHLPLLVLPSPEANHGEKKRGRNKQAKKRTNQRKERNHEARQPCPTRPAHHGHQGGSGRPIMHEKGKRKAKQSKAGTKGRLTQLPTPPEGSHSTRSVAGEGRVILQHRERKLGRSGTGRTDGGEASLASSVPVWLLADKVRNVHGHLVNLGAVVLLNVAQDTNVV